MNEIKTEIRFYHLQHQSQDAVLPALLGKAIERGHKIVVKLRDAADVSKTNDHLWTYHPNSFLPHGSDKDGHAASQPIFLTDSDDNPNNADVLIMGQGVGEANVENYALCCDMLNGHDAEEINHARARWKTYKENGYTITYWQQNEQGGWEKKA